MKSYRSNYFNLLIITAKGGSRNNWIMACTFTGPHRALGKKCFHRTMFDLFSVFDTNWMDYCEIRIPTGMRLIVGYAQDVICCQTNRLSAKSRIIFTNHMDLDGCSYCDVTGLWTPWEESFHCHHITVLAFSNWNQQARLLANNLKIMSH